MRFIGRRECLLAALTLPGLATAAGPLKIVATFSVLGDMVRRVAGDQVALTVIVGPDGDTEAYMPTAGDARALAEANLLVSNGLNPEFEPWLDGLIRQSGFRGTKLVASNGIRVLKKADEHHNDAKSDEIDQHGWHDALNAAMYAANIQAALVASDTAQAGQHRTRGEAYRRELLELDRWAKSLIGSVPSAKRKVISSHDGFAYLARAYGIRMTGARGWTNDKEPSARQVAELINQIRAEKVRALFIENMNDPRLIQRVARETGVEIGGKLYSDALSGPGSGADTYVSMFRHNIETLQAGMMKN